MNIVTLGIGVEAKAWGKSLGIVIKRCKICELFLLPRVIITGVLLPLLLYTRNSSFPENVTEKNLLARGSK